MKHLAWMAALALAAAWLASTGALADEEKKPVDKSSKEAKQALKGVDPAFRIPETVALSDDQKAKLEGLRKEFEPKLAEVRAKSNVLTDEQKGIQTQSKQEAKKSGKSGKELAAELDGKLKLTDDQKKALSEGKQEASDLYKTIGQRISEILTEDQRKQLEEAKKGSKKPGEQPAKGEKPVTKEGKPVTKEGKKPAGDEKQPPRKPESKNPEGNGKKPEKKNPDSGKSPERKPEKKNPDAGKEPVKKSRE